MVSLKSISDYELRYHIAHLPVTAANWPDRMAKLLAEKKRREGKNP